MNALAIFNGGGVRIGLEDNIFYDHKSDRLAKNIELVERVHNLAEICGRKIMTSSKLREKLGLNEGNGNYGLKSE